MTADNPCPSCRKSDRVWDVTHLLPDDLRAIARHPSLDCRRCQVTWVEHSITIESELETLRRLAAQQGATGNQWNADGLNAVADLLNDQVFDSIEEDRRDFEKRMP